MNDATEVGNGSPDMPREQLFIRRGNGRSTNQRSAYDGCISHTIPAIDDYPVTTDSADIIRSVLKRTYEEDIVKINMNVSSGARQYVASIIACPPKHYVLANYVAGPIVADK